ncbi:MAG: YidC/Oxa1 family membrane protein insertase [Treponema sp.]|nr:YidC/Oxa1 family membrane protein insertase [Treponema sp.]
MAEKQQQAEREKQKNMKRMKDNIKSAFKGDKQYMILSTLYRQHNYHPLYALRNSIDLFIQIPFFIAAYHFLSNLEMLNGQAFKFIKDLGAPDGLYKGINILPILMTLLNIVSGVIYTKGLPIKDKIQVYGIGAIFLVLLYNSPSALVLYWTSNNIYNLIKNILLKTKNAKKLVIGLAVFIGGNTTLYMLFFHGGSLKKRLFVIALIAIASLIPVLKRIISYLRKKIDIKGTALDCPGRTFALSLIGLFLLIGLVIPSSLIASDVEEFSFLGPYSSPLPYLGIVLMQSAGILLWLACIYYLFDRKVRILLTILCTAALGLFLLNSFLFTGEYGFMTPDLLFSEFKNASSNQIMINIVAIQLVTIGIFGLLTWKKEKVIFTLQCIAVLGMLSFGIINIAKIEAEFRIIINIFASNGAENADVLDNDYEKSYTFSKSGKNVLVIVLDKAVSGLVPYIFKEIPELQESFNGFTYYPNTTAFGQLTLYSMPAIFGGYYYTPLEIQKRKDELWWNKFYESMQVLPRIMAENNFYVTVYNQPWMNYSLYDEFNKINAGRNIWRYTKYYLDKYANEINNIDSYKILYFNFMRFSFFKCSPVLLHKVLYDNGKYHSQLENDLDLSTYRKATLDHYSTLYFLREATELINNEENYFTIFINELTHEPAFFEAPDYKPSRDVVNKGNSQFAEDSYYHVNIASFLLIGRWFDFLKMNGVYDNTRIIIVSDHGNPVSYSFPGNFKLPNGRNMSNFSGLLLVKDFNSETGFNTNEKFMTVADIPHIVTSELVKDLINPFTGKALVIDKDNGVTVTTSLISSVKQTLEYGYDIKKNEWYHVSDNIFNLAKWTSVTINE